MANCARCCLHKSMRIVNLIMLLFGSAMIVYSLWLLRRWNDSIALLPSGSSLPRPWFIFTCLGLGIAVCLSTLCGHMISNCISNSSLCIYIVFICCAIFLEVAVIVSIFFKMDWQSKIAEYIDKYHKEFERFVLFHVNMCRLITLLVLAAQYGLYRSNPVEGCLDFLMLSSNILLVTNRTLSQQFSVANCAAICKHNFSSLCSRIYVVVLAVTMCAVGTVPRTHCEELYVPSFTQSFLVPSLPGPAAANSSHACRRCEILRYQENPRRSFLSLIMGMLRAQFGRSYTVY